MTLEPGKWYDVGGSRWQFVRSMRCSASSIKRAGYGGRYKPDPHGKMIYFFKCKKGRRWSETSHFSTDDVSKATVSKEQRA